MNCVLFAIEKQNIKKYWKNGKKNYWKSPGGNFVSPEKWEPCNAGNRINTNHASLMQNIGLVHTERK